MCGFAGFVRQSQRAVVVNDQLLEALRQSIAHRGPDAGGSWVSSDQSIALINQRLSIIDVSHAGTMPMQDARHGYVITYNGEIYNYQELRSELTLLGYEFFSHTDTETILYAYDAWGMRFLDKLDGMFAFALYDQNADEILLVRDRMGVKPLYFSEQQGIISFASEIKSLWQMPWNAKKVSEVAMYHYLTFMVAPAPYTIYDRVYKLPAGFYARISAQRTLSFHEWYSPIKQLSVAQRREYNDETWCTQVAQQLLVQAVKKRMVADVSVGAFLSGGIDSSLIVALMAQHASIKTFTVGFADAPEHDERWWARMIAARFETDHHEIIIGEREAFDLYERMYEMLDEPLADCVCIPFYYVAKLAHEHGCRVVQVGEGADELFFGYDTYAKHAQLHAALWRPSQRLLPAAVRSTVAWATQPLLAKKLDYQDLLNNWARGRSLFWGGAIAFNEEQKEHFIIPNRPVEHDEIINKIYPGLRQEFDSFAIVDYHMQRLYEQMPHADFGQQMLYLELKQRLPELLLMRADKMAMANSVEAREPFLDYRLVEHMMQVPLAFKYKHATTKYMLKKIAQGILPDIIIQRKKVGFGAPTTRWLRNGQLFPQYFAARSGNVQQYPLFNQRVHSFDKQFTVHPQRLAVQHWVLQALWAMR